MRLLVLILAATAAALGQPAAKLTGFPFQNESLRYSLRLPTGLAIGEAIAPRRQLVGQLGHAPARQRCRVPDPADREPALAVGHDAHLVARSGELLSGQRRALL